MTERFSILDEQWIKVIHKETGETQTVNLNDLFSNAHYYQELAGETAIQDFAVMRFILSILHTVFSRYDSKGETYPYIEIDERMRQIQEIDEDDYEDYEDDLMQSWYDLWQQKQFPSIVNQYLEEWRDRFYLFSDDYPFYQVTEEVMNEQPIKGSSKPGTKKYRNINGELYESSNKERLVSNVNGGSDVKDRVNLSDFVRWLITYQGYNNTGDKAKWAKANWDVEERFNGFDIREHTYGWLYNLGGVYVKGSNLYETLMMNLILVHPEEQYRFKQQKPYWEFETDSLLENLSKGINPDNLAELYTNWGRLVHLEQTTQDGDIIDVKNKKLSILKTYNLNRNDYFLEPMTAYQNLKESKGLPSVISPRVHRKQEMMWSQLGRIYLEGYVRRPGIMNWYIELDALGLNDLTIQTVSAISNGNAPSWDIVDIYSQTIELNSGVSKDIQDDGWIVRINDEASIIQKIIEQYYSKFLIKLYKIRGETKPDITNEIAYAYNEIDKLFRQWMAGILLNDTKNEKVVEWRTIFKKEIYKIVDGVVKPIRIRDYYTVEIEDGKNKETLNMAIILNDFMEETHIILKGG